MRVRLVGGVFIGDDLTPQLRQYSVGRGRRRVRGGESEEEECGEEDADEEEEKTVEQHGWRRDGG